jgi:hypothetical protein
MPGVEILLRSPRNQAMGTDLFTGIGCPGGQEHRRRQSSQHFHASYSKIAARATPAPPRRWLR